MNSEEKKAQKIAFNKRIYHFIIRLIKFLAKLPQTPITREIISQLMRSGTSMGANYYEAEAASSKRDFQNFFSYSLKSSNESVFWLSLLKDSGLIPTLLISEQEWLLKEAKELANIFASSILTMKGKR